MGPRGGSSWSTASSRSPILASMHGRKVLPSFMCSFVPVRLLPTGILLPRYGRLRCMSGGNFWANDLCIFFCLLLRLPFRALFCLKWAVVMFQLPSRAIFCQQWTVVMHSLCQWKDIVQWLVHLRGLGMPRWQVRGRTILHWLPRRALLGHCRHYIIFSVQPVCRWLLHLCYRRNSVLCMWPWLFKHAFGFRSVY